MAIGVKVAARDYNIAGNLENFQMERYADRNDVRWFHPEFQPYLTGVADTEIAEGNTLYLCDDSIPLETRRKTRQGIYDLFDQIKKAELEAHPEWRDAGEYREYTVPGCEKEPETSCRVLVRTPKDVKEGERLPVIFYCMGGALVMVCPSMHALERMSCTHHAVIVCPVFRSCIDAPYPAAINDVHAAYKWMVENAGELHIDTEQVIIYGGSSGGHLASCLNFRLKEYAGYGVHPRGTILIDPVLDNRFTKPCHKMCFHMNDARSYMTFTKKYVGEVNFGSPYLPPDCFANYATVEDCRGLPPMFVHTVEHDAERDVAFEFVQKLLAAEVYTEFHEWGGGFHAIQQVTDSDYVQRYTSLIDGQIKDCLQYDLRRLWNK